MAKCFCKMQNYIFICRQGWHIRVKRCVFQANFARDIVIHSHEPKAVIYFYIDVKESPSEFRVKEFRCRSYALFLVIPNQQCFKVNTIFNDDITVLKIKIRNGVFSEQKFRLSYSYFGLTIEKLRIYRNKCFLFKQSILIWQDQITNFRRLYVKKYHYFIINQCILVFLSGGKISNVIS